MKGGKNQSIYPFNTHLPSVFLIPVKYQKKKKRERERKQNEVVLAPNPCGHVNQYNNMTEVTAKWLEMQGRCNPG